MVGCAVSGAVKLRKYTVSRRDSVSARAAADHPVEPGRRAGRALDRALAVVVEVVPVGRPFPQIARHVVEAEAVGRERADRNRAGAGAAVGAADQRRLGAGGRCRRRRSGELLTPGIVEVGLAAAGGTLPFRFGRQPPADRRAMTCRRRPS